jgi:hypothetical protein
MAATEIQNSVSITDRKQFAYDVHLTARDIFVANRTGVGEEVDLIKHGLPPVSVYLHAHDLPGLVPKL